MADGRTHAKIASGVTLAVSAAALPVGVHDAAAALALVVGAVAGFAISPDLDLEGRTEDEARIWRISPVLGFLWQTYWYPYALLIPHRHWLSHAPGIGTLIRMLYVGWWIPLIAPVDWRFVVVMWLAWCVQDIAHLAADGWRFHS